MVNEKENRIEISGDLKFFKRDSEPFGLHWFSTEILFEAFAAGFDSGDGISDVRSAFDLWYKNEIGWRVKFDECCRSLPGAVV